MNKHHDQIFGDFDGDGGFELVFWNQGSNSLIIAEIPDNPADSDEWACTPIYQYSSDSEMQQTGSYPSWKGTNEHEGLDKIDIDDDGIEDIVGGGLWFKYKNGMYIPNSVDHAYTFSRCAAGQLIEGGRPEIVLVVGDGIAPMNMYEWIDGTWTRKMILPGIDNGHTLDIIDFNGDSHLDIFNAEMRLDGGNDDAMIRILLGDGKGNFRVHIVAEGIGVHEGKISDLDGDGDFDILAKPYNWETPRIDIFLNLGKTE